MNQKALGWKYTVGTDIHKSKIAAQGLRAHSSREQLVTALVRHNK